MLTQIYEVTTPAEAQAISTIGVNHVGVLVGDGSFPRELSVNAAAAVMRATQAPSKVSALFLSADVMLIEHGTAASATDFASWCINGSVEAPSRDRIAQSAA